jgi:pentatricopeptide repeat protein
MSTMRGARRSSLVGLFLWASLATVSAQTVVDPYYEFIMARRLEAQGDARGALAAFERAAAAAPQAAEIRAEIAAYHMRQNHLADAERAAREALALDDSSIEAHRVLGLLLSASDSKIAEAIVHLERVMATPTGATDISLQFSLGRLYFFSGALPKAIETLTRVVEDQPQLSQARLMLAQALSAAGRHDEAIELLEPAAQIDSRLSATLAQLYERAGRIGDAASAYGKAATANPANRDAQIRYASALLAQGGRDNAKKALGVVAALVERNSKDAGALYLQSQAYRESGDIFAAERSARALLAIDPNSPSGTYALAQVFMASRRFRDVIGLLEPFTTAAVTRGENVTNLLSYLSGAYQSLGQYDQAIAALRRAKAADKEGSSSLDLYLVQTHIVAKKYADAAALAEEAQKRFPEDLRFSHLQARALFRAGSQPRAISMLEALIKAVPDELDTYTTLADLYGQAGRVDDGVRLLNDAAKRFPGETKIAFRRGAVLAEAKRIAEAEQAFKEVLAEDPEHADTLNYLGYMLADRGTRLDEAIGLITRALKIEQDNPSFLDSLGWAQFKRGDLAEAEKNMTRAADNLPFNSVVQDHYGDVLARAGKYREAVTAWTKSLNGDGDDIDRAAIERKIRDARAKIKN